MQNNDDSNNYSTISIVVPVHNEQDALLEFYEELSSSINGLKEQCEIIFVNDGSRDRSLEILKGLKRIDPRIGILNLSRCFGKEYALTAGLSHMNGDAAIILDADLQDPPRCIPDMVASWKSGAEVVLMKRVDRSIDSRFKRTSANLFYKVIDYLSDVEVPDNVGDFRLMSKKVVDAVLSLPEANRCLKALFSWVGFKTVSLEYIRQGRVGGDSKWPLLKLIGLALDGITSSSIKPLRLATFLGALLASLSMIYAIFVAARTLIIGDPVQGFTTLLILICFLGGTQLLAIGVLGEYVGRTFVEVKNRPLFIVSEFLRPHTTVASSSIQKNIKLPSPIERKLEKLIEEESV